MLGLRDEDVQSSVPRLQPQTLRRLVEDVERTQHAKVWLREARKVLRDARARVASSLLPGKPKGEAAGSRGVQTGKCAIVARPTSSGTWQVGIALPNFAALASSLGVELKRIDDILTTFAGEATAMPARALLALSGTPRPIASLSKSTGRNVLSFAPPASWSDKFGDQCFVADRARWLLRVHNDGWAREVRGHNVRPNEDYLLICKEPVSEAAASRLGLTSCAVSLEDGTVHEFSVPASVSSEYDDALKELGLGRVLTTVVEPVGLVPRRAPGDVRTVWLATEEPIFALSSEALETEFIVTLDDAEVTRVAVQADGPTLVALSNLPLGPHRLQVASVTKSGQAQTREAEEIEIEIRAPIPWSMDSMRAAGFRLALTPEGASIDDLIGGNAAATAIAPSGRTGQLTAQTFSSTGVPVDRIDLGQIRFPAQPRTMSQRLAKLGADPASEWVHQAPETVINLSLEELGTQSLRFRRRVDPLRWTLRRDDDSYLVRLIDDSDSEETVEVARYDIAQPDTKVSLDLATAMEGIRVDQPGALFSARLAKRSFRLAVSVSPHAVSSLAALGIGVYISDETKSATKIPRLLALIRLWRDAAWQGQLVLHRKEAVLRALDRVLAEAVCGAKWSGRLEQFNHRPDADLADLQREVGGSPGFAHRMRTTNFFQPVDGQPPEQAFVNWAVGYKIVDDPSIAALAFKLAFHPTKLRVDDPGERVSTLSGVVANRPLCRGAFLARLASERLSRPPEIPA